MIDLKDVSGLPILFDEKDLNLEFLDDFPSIKKSQRSLVELKPFTRNPEVTSGPDPVYYMWRRAHLKKDDSAINAQNIRYDLTLLAPGKLDGKEFVKTAGHYHQIKAGTGLRYPEVYEVLYGVGYFLIQRMDDNFSEVKEVYLIEATPKEKVLIPPGFGHLTINVYDKPLLVANWVSTTIGYNYEPYKDHRGAAYYLVENEFGNVDIIKNSSYGKIPEIKKLSAKELPQFGLIESRPMYELTADLGKLRFLNYPEEFAQEISVQNIYKL